MNRTSIPIKLLNTALGPREVKARRFQVALAKFGRGPRLPNSEGLPRACAMVNAALNQNGTVRALWVDIHLAWDLPGCAAFDSFAQGDGELRPWVESALKGIITPLPQGSINRARHEWQANFSEDPDIITLNGLIDSFILKGFNGPINPTPRPVLGAVKYQLRVPTYKILVKPETVKPVLKHAILFLTWCEHKRIDLRELDRERMGADYELVTTSKKPTTTWGRERKAGINNLVHNAELSFISEKAIQAGADKWYHARVIKGSITEAADKYQIYPGTLANEIAPFDHIAGLR